MLLTLPNEPILRGVKALFISIKSPLSERLCTAAFLLLIFQRLTPSLSHLITDLAYPLLLLGLAVMLKEQLRDSSKKAHAANHAVSGLQNNQR